MQLQQSILLAGKEPKQPRSQHSPYGLRICTRADNTHKGIGVN
jgi:hypothetical protein